MTFEEDSTLKERVMSHFVILAITWEALVIFCSRVLQKRFKWEAKNREDFFKRRNWDALCAT